MELEKDLVEKAQASDRSAFDRLAGDSRSRLAAFVRSRLGEELRSRHEVDDLVQETLLRAYRSIGRFEWQGNGSFLRWTTSIAELLILDLARTAARQVNSQVDITRDLPGDEPPPERGLRREEPKEKKRKGYLPQASVKQMPRRGGQASREGIDVLLKSNALPVTWRRICSFERTGHSSCGARVS